MTNLMRDKVVLITGGTGGIGKETAIELVRLGAHVVVTGRNKSRSEAGVADIKRQSGQTKVDLLLADLSKQSEIHRLAEDFTAKYARLDVLINNLGGLYAERWKTADGIEATFAVNHLTPLLLTRLLLPMLKASGPARIINVTGGMPSTKLDLNNLQGEKRFLALQNYSQAKVVMMAGAYDLAQQLQGSGVTLNVAYPGGANTAMTQAMTPAMVPWFMKMAWPLFGRFMANASPAKAARSSIYLASSPEVEGANGNYYDTNSKPAKWPKAVLNEDNRRFIRELSEQLIKSPVSSVGRAG